MTDLAALTLFAFSGSFTPGPNTIMVTASGTAFGFQRSIPHMVGITVGFPLMLIAVGFGLGQVFVLYPSLHSALKIAGAVYLLYLASRIANAGAPRTGGTRGEPLSIVEAAAFQWVNPKAWTLALSAIPAFTTSGGNYANEVFTVAATFGLISLPIVSVWCLFGTAIRHFVEKPGVLRIVNLTLAAMVAASVALLFI